MSDWFGSVVERERGAGSEVRQQEVGTGHAREARVNASLLMIWASAEVHPGYRVRSAKAWTQASRRHGEYFRVRFEDLFEIVLVNPGSFL